MAAKAYFNTRNQDGRVVVPTALTDTFDAPGHPADLLNTVFWRSMQDNGVELCRQIR